MPIIGLAGVTVAFALLLTKAYGTDLAPYLYKMWCVFALWSFGLRLSHMLAISDWIVGVVGGIL